ncbi:MAG: AAA family ATPase, partial [Candidatus Thiodiazotropha sp.]
INLLSMLSRFTPDDAVRVATDSLYIRKTALHKLDGVESFVVPKICDCEATLMCVACMLREPFLSPVAPAQWRDKGEQLFMPQEHAAYLAEPAFMATKRDLPPSTAPRHNDPLLRHALSYLNGGGGSGKTTRAIELFRQKEHLVFTPTHRLVKEMRARGAKAQTYHSFFRRSGQTEWTPERMRQKYIPRVIIWDEVCTVPRPILGTWLQRRADYYEEVLADHRAKEPALKALKREIRLQPDRVQCRAMRKVLPTCLGWDRFMEAWKPGDLILTSRQKVRDPAQQLLFERNVEYFPYTPVPLLYRPKSLGGKISWSQSRAGQTRKSSS